MYTEADRKRREQQLEQDRKDKAARVAKLREAEQAKRRTAPPPFGAPYGNTSSYTPASDTSAAPFVPAAENYSPPATESSSPAVEAGGGLFDGGGASGDW